MPPKSQTKSKSRSVSGRRKRKTERRATKSRKKQVSTLGGPGVKASSDLPPLHPVDPPRSPAEIEAILRAKYKRRLEDCQAAFESGNLAGLYDAPRFCLACARNISGAHGQPELLPTDLVEMPTWVVEAILDLTDEQIRTRGTALHKWFRRFWREMRDLERAGAVDDLKGQGLWTDKRIFKEANSNLTGTGLAYSPSAVEYSYACHRKTEREGKYISQYLNCSWADSPIEKK